MILCPPPVKDFCVEVEYITDAARMENHQSAAEGGQGRLLGGQVYTDGSCTTEVIRELRRAGCSGVEVNADGQPQARISTPIPRHFRQTAQVAEHVGFATTVALLRRKSTLHADCMGVVKAAREPLRQAIRHSKIHAGTILTARTDVDHFNLLDDVKWVKAHRTEHADMNDEDRRHVRGNADADEAAKDAVKRHEQLSHDQRTEIELFCKRAPLVVKAVGTALALFPPVQERMTRVARPSNADEAMAKRRHLWVFAEGTWRCEICSTWVASHRLRGSRRREVCPGPCLDSRIKEFDGHGHRLCRTDGPVPILFCSRCGAWSSRRPRKLKRSCVQATAPGKQALQRLAEGRRPWIARKWEGGSGKRGSVGRVAAYDRTEDAWKDCAGGGAEALSSAAKADDRGGAGDPTVTQAAADGHEDTERRQPTAPGASAVEDDFEADEEAAMAMGNYDTTNLGGSTDTRNGHMTNKRKLEAQDGVVEISIATRRTRA